MAKKLFTVLVLIGIMVALLASSGFSKAKYDTRSGYNPTSVSLKKYAFPQVRFKPVAWGDAASPADDNAADNPYRRSSVGTAMTPGNVASPGFEVIASYNDDQMFPGGNRQVDFRGTSPSIQFVYGAATSTAQPGKFGYNVYDPTNGGDWPRGAGVGCVIQASDGEGWWDNMDLSPNGYVVIGGADDASGTLDNHFFWQSSPHGCYWGTGAQIAPAQYDANFLTPSNFLGHLRMEYQIVGDDTVLHVIAVESAPTNLIGDIDGNSLTYFRKTGNDHTGTWLGPITLDTMNRSSGSQAVSNGSISASRISSKVLVAYTHHHADAITNDQRYDVEVYIATSDNGGVDWKTAGACDIDMTVRPELNITSYSRTEASGLAFINTHCLLDSEDGAHVIWTAGLTVDNVYDDNTYFWGDFSASLYHWTDRVASAHISGGTMTKAHNADWGIDVNTQVCGFPSPGLSYLGYESVAECDGRIYLFASQYNDFYGNWGVPHIDDCASGFSNRLFAANGEVFMVVSSGLNGILWDAARNLTNTYTAGCDSAGYGGICMNDGRATVSRFGMDSAAYGEALTWPGGELVEPDGPAWTGSKYLHVFYTEDHYPAPGWRSLQGDSPADYNEVTLNPLKWMRVPCVEPISAAQIFVSDDHFGIANGQWMKHTETFTETITVTNDGNATLDITAIAEVETAPTSDWLSTTETSMTVLAGVDNTGTFDLTLDGTVIGAPGTTVALNGTITLTSNAANFPSKVIEIVNFLVTDTVIGLEFDTVSTAIVSLVVATSGEMGVNGANNGDGTVNLDYVTLGGECNPSTVDPNTSVYLYSGGPVVVQHIGAFDNVLNQAMHELNNPANINWQRVLDKDPAHLTGGNYDGFFTGTVVNEDTTLAFERTVYAPTGNNGYMIVKTDYYSFDGSAVSGLMIGEQIDWDVPTDRGSDNNSILMSAHNTVAFQGLDTATVAPCQLNADRFGAMYFMGMHTTTDTTDAPCVSTCDAQGMYAMENDTLFAAPADADSLGEYFWNQAALNPGTSASSVQGVDLHGIMTAVHDYTLDAGEVLTIYHAVATVGQGTITDLEDNLDAAFEWYRINLRPGCDQLCGCCIGLTGNVDGDPGDVVDIGDLTALINYLFIPPFPVPACIEEANADGTGGVDIGDLTGLINYLFIPPFPLPAPC